MKNLPPPGLLPLALSLDGLKARPAGIIERMTFAARPGFVTFLLLSGLNCVFTPVAQTQQEAPVYDPDTDPRIDRRPHPNAPRNTTPRNTAPETLLPFGDAANAPAPPPDNPVFLDFAAWIQKYRLASQTQKINLVAEGLELAKKRRSALADLIQTNPKRAIEWAISSDNRALLPSEVQAQLEMPLIGCGEYAVLIAYSRPNPSPKTTPGQGQNSAPKTSGNLLSPPVGSSTLIRRAIFNRETIYKAYVYGWRRGLTTKYNIPLHGITLDDLFAIDDNPARVLKKGELVPNGANIGNPDKKCPLCNADFSENTGVTAQIGDTFYFFDSQEHLQKVVEALIQAQLVIGPKFGGCDEPLVELIKQAKQRDLSKTGISAGHNAAPTVAF